VLIRKRFLREQDVGDIEIPGDQIGARMNSRVRSKAKTKAADRTRGGITRARAAAVFLPQANPAQHKTATDIMAMAVNKTPGCWDRWEVRMQ